MSEWRVCLRVLLRAAAGDYVVLIIPPPLIHEQALQNNEAFRHLIPPSLSTSFSSSSASASSYTPRTKAMLQRTMAHTMTAAHELGMSLGMPGFVPIGRERDEDDSDNEEGEQRSRELQRASRRRSDRRAIFLAITYEVSH